jgi:hypothetical protein
VNVECAAQRGDLQEAGDGAMVSTGDVQLDFTTGSGFTGGDQTRESCRAKEGDFAEVEHEVLPAFVEVTLQVAVQQRRSQRVQLTRHPHHPYARSWLVARKANELLAPVSY